MRCWQVGLLLVCSMLTGQTAQESIQQGVEAYKAAQYDEAIESFQQAVSARPQSLKAALYLATAHLADLYTSPGDVEKARRAQQAFTRVLEIDAGNRLALSSLMVLGFQEAQTATGGDQARLWEELRQECLSLLAIDPKHPEAHYTIAVVQWLRFYPAYLGRTGRKRDEPAPIRDAKLRAALRKEWGPMIEDAIQHLQTALDANPLDSRPMVYLNLFIRRRAELADNPSAYQVDMLKAEAWVKRAGEAQGKSASTPLSLAPPPLPVFVEP